jgi:hypothetical protein
MVRSRRPALRAHSAPDLIGPVSILNWPVASGPGTRHRRPRPFTHVRLEVDLVPGMERESRLPILRQIEEALNESEIVEEGDLLRLVAGLLHSVAVAGYRRVDHWEVRPGGWLSFAPTPRGPQVEPVGQLVRALQLDQWKPVAGAKEFAGRLSSTHGIRLAFVLRRVHRARRHSISIELTGVFRKREVDALLDAIRSRMPVMRAELAEFARA